MSMVVDVDDDPPTVNHDVTSRMKEIVAAVVGDKLMAGRRSFLIVDGTFICTSYTNHPQ